MAGPNPGSGSISDSARQDHGHQHGPLATSAHATAHCLLGCMVGETAGLAIGTAAGLGLVTTLVLAVGLAYVSGFALALVPVMRQQNLSFRAAMSVVWLGEAVSIAAMETAMNAADYAVGGLTASSLSDPVFWYGIAIAAPVGFLAAWPVNHWLLAKKLKAGH